MKKITANKSRRQPVNLSLTAEAISRLEELQVALHRPSKSNVVEVLVSDKARELKLHPA